MKYILQRSLFSFMIDQSLPLKIFNAGMLLCRPNECKGSACLITSIGRFSSSCIQGSINNIPNFKTQKYLIKLPSNICCQFFTCSNSAIFNKIYANLLQPGRHGYSMLHNRVSENTVPTPGLRYVMSKSGKNKIGKTSEKTTVPTQTMKMIKKKKRQLADSEVVPRAGAAAAGGGRVLLQHHFLTFDPGLELPHLPPPRRRKPDFEVTAYATADSYNLETLLQGFKDLGLYERSSHHRPSVHNTQHRCSDISGISISRRDENATSAAAAADVDDVRQGLPSVEGFAPLSSQSDDELDVIPNLSEVLHVVGKYKITTEEREIYFFRDGTVVFWNVAELERSNVINYLKRFSVGDTAGHATVHDQSESFPYIYTTGKTQLKEDRILLGEGGPLHLERYTFSNALAVSVKLGIWEAEMDEYVDNMENVSRELKKTGHIILKKKEVLQRLGQLYELRHSLTLSSDLLDTPDYYWDRKALGQLYEGTYRNLCIAKRTDVMNVKLNHCVELVELLKGHHGEEQGHRLEKIIIYLIVIEVVFEVLHFIV